MTKAEIEFLRAAGFSIAEIMAMTPVQNDEKEAAATAGSDAAAGQNAQIPIPKPTPDPAQTITPPAEPAAPAATPAPAGDLQSAMLDKLDKLLAAVQAGNRSGAAMPTPEKKSVEEIAGQLY